GCLPALVARPDCSARRCSCPPPTRWATEHASLLPEVTGPLVRRGSAGPIERGDPRPELGPDLAEKPRGLHLADTELCTDLLLGQPPHESQVDHPALPLRQLAHGGTQHEPGLHSGIVVRPGGEAVRPSRTGSARCVYRHCAGHVLRQLRLPQLTFVHTGGSSQLLLGRVVTQVLHQSDLMLAQLQLDLLQPAWWSDRPHRVPEVALDLPGDRGYGIGDEGASLARLVATDRLAEAESTDLHEVVPVDSTAPVPRGD